MGEAKYANQTTYLFVGIYTTVALIKPNPNHIHAPARFVPNTRNSAKQSACKQLIAAIPSQSIK